MCGWLGISMLHLSPIIYLLVTGSQLSKINAQLLLYRLQYQSKITSLEKHKNKAKILTTTPDITFQSGTGIIFLPYEPYE